MYVSVVFVIKCLYSAVTLTLVREQRFIRIIYFYCYYYYYSVMLDAVVILPSIVTHAC